MWADGPASAAGTRRATGCEDRPEAFSDSCAHHETTWDMGQDSAGQRNTGQHRTTQHRASQDNTAQHGTGQHRTGQHGAMQHGATRGNTAQHGIGQHRATQHRATWDNTAQHGTGQHPGLLCRGRWRASGSPSSSWVPRSPEPAPWGQAPQGEPLHGPRMWSGG